MAENELCGLYKEAIGTYTTEGLTKLCEGLKGSAITSLKCAAAHRSARSLLSDPAGTYSSIPPTPSIPARTLACSLGGNQLFGVSGEEGTYTTEGITKLCEGLKGSAITSLKCAAAPSARSVSQTPLAPTPGPLRPPHP